MDEHAVERVFRALVRGPNVAMAVRDPHTLAEIAAIAQLDLETVKQVVVEFSAEDNLFLRVDEPVTAESYADLNHESLIRQWSLLSDWVRKEAESAEVWQSLARGAAAWKKAGEPENDLPTGPGLARRLAWWASEAPNPAWAARYCDPQMITVDEVDRYLQKAKLGEELRQTETERQRQWGRMTLAVIAALVVVLAFSFALYTQATAAKTEAQRQNDQLTQSGDRLKQEVARANANAKIAKRNAGNAIEFAAEARRNGALAEANASQARMQAALAQQNAIQLVRARQLAAQRIADAANSGKLEVLKDNFDDLAVQQQSADVSLSDVKRRYQRLQDHLNAMSGGGADRARLLAKVETELATGEGREIATGGDPAVAVVGRMRTRAQDARRLSSEPVTLARSALVEAAAHQIMMEHPAAIEKYKQVLAASDQIYGDESALMATQANASLAALTRATGALDQSEIFLGACARSYEKLSKDSLWIARTSLWALECKRLGADIEIDRRNFPTAEQALQTIQREFPSKRSLTVPEIGLLIRVAVAASRFRYSGERREDGLTAARNFYEAHPDSEEASDLYADGLYSKGDYYTALEIRRPFLAAGGTSLAYLANSERLIRTSLTQWEGESSPTLLPGTDAGGSGVIPDAVANVLRNRLTRIFHFALMASTLHRLSQAQVTRLPGVPSSPDEPDRNTLVATIADKARLNATWLSDTIETLADHNGLLGDLRRSSDVMVNSADVVRSRSIASFVSSYEDACQIKPDEWDGPQVVTIVEDCRAAAANLRRRLDPVIRLVATAQSTRPFAQYDSSKFWLGGLDPVPYRNGSPLERGQTDLPFEWQGRAFLFASETNRELFRKDPAAYLPDFGGNAPNWVRIGEAVEGNPWVYCLSGSQLFLFEKSEDREGWCSEGRPTRETAARIVQARLSWERIKARPASGPVQFASPLAADLGKDLGPWRIFGAAPRSEVRAPAGGRLLPSLGSTVVIEHAGGLHSELSNVVGDVAARQMVAAGDVIGHVLNREDGTVIVRWAVYKTVNEQRRRISVSALLPQ